MHKGMIKATLFFPGGEDDAFDMDYYLNKHVPLIKRLLGKAIKGLTVEKGVSGGAPGSMAPFIAVAGLYFDSMDAFQDYFEPYAGEIMNDLMNISDSKPLLLISEIMQ